jgi:DNA mismatch endonuclease (patch repair protein)
VPDIFSRAKRSDVMSRIRSRGNKATEQALAKFFRARRLTGWRRHLMIQGRARSPLRAGAGAHGVTCPTFRVRPDFVFPRRRLAVFVDGCFWHGCPWHGTRPKGNAAFWRRKFARNRERDRVVNRALRRAGWRVLRIWEHTLRQAAKGAKNEARLLHRLRQMLAGSS